MVDTQHFCLRWNNYQSSITSAFENLRDDEDFVDVTLACDGKSLKAHRVVLSACSPYFRELLKSTPCKHPVIVLQDVAFTDLHALVEFIYHGEVNVHQRSLSSFLKTAEVLRVSGLTQQHGEERGDIAAQVQQQTNNNRGGTPQNHHSPPLHHPDDIPSPESNGHPPRRSSNSRRERRNSLEQQITESEQKRPRQDINLNNNSPPEQLTPTDFSPSAMKHAAALAALHNSESIGHGNGLDSAPHSPHITAGLPPRPTNHDDDVKNEPMDASLDIDNNSMDSNSGTDKKGPPSNCSVGDHDEHDLRIHPAFLTASDSKLFATAAGTFNFSMAALTGDPTGLAGLGSPSLQSTAESLAGTSQGMLSMLHGNSAAVAAAAALKKLFTCMRCGKVLCSKASLKRHIADKHAERHEEYRCVICERVYCSRNSLMTHIYTYHKSRPGDIDIKFF
ncbi:broad-complex core protein isoforms 1/2/3/4/5 isoform X2 [Chrysoperla carnea]|uniref:broad-complex core protein isoforms 1/2/3/4/5 isoform X2 n=1 Tax=Chrysoperla carnea TaxID=189513 RepID=UPI001D075384|nr:broad-complex core protein isoforms 1/2/3/4/5 isoform X2 [Chrysoperla carnea]